ncbi:MAG: diguanylate cyclase [Methylophilaceae bacterium]|nr:diguanylate cyclase [Methylophilaceae bacterium]
MTKIEQLRLNGQLPSPKGVALAIVEVSRRDDASVDEISRVVQTDPALAGRLLRLANSATYAGRPVAAIRDAIMRLGLAAVRQLAVSFSLVDQNQSGACTAFDYPQFWAHSLMMAVAMQELGKLTRVAAPDELFACGLMARIGCLALSTIYPVEYGGLLKQLTPKDNLAQLERQILQTDHNEFTSAVLTDCGIPKAFVEPVYYHEVPEASGFSEGSRPYQLVHLFYHAKRLADLGLAQPSDRNAIVSELMLLGGKIGLDAEDLGNLVDRIFTSWHEWGKLLQVPSGVLPTFSKMMTAPAPASGEESLSTALRVLVVEDDPSSRTLLEGVLGSILGQKVYSAVNGQEALAVALEVMPQIVVTDWLMPVMDGIEFCRALRATEWGQSMYVIMLTSIDAEEEIIDAFDAGVDDFVTKPLNVRALRARMRAALHYVKLLENWERDRLQLKQFAAELAISNRKLEHFAHTDLLTGLQNRRAGMSTLDQAWSAANRSGQLVTGMMIDIDRFKSVNDSYGHAVGDVVLKEVAAAIRDSARKDDSIFRMGGEEFFVVCHNTDLKSTFHAAERMRFKVKNLRIKVGETEIQTSISIGLACKESDMPDVDALVKAADQALYAAKHGGRDRTCLIVEGKLRCGQSEPA